MNAAPHTARGRFITFEGGEGAGKSTQIQRLASRLDAMGVATLITREPGGCDLAEQIRALLVQGDPGGMEPVTELFLVLAARRQHVMRVIQPALEAGKWVLCDRFHDSTLAYQGAGRNLAGARLDSAEQWARDDLTPDLTLFLDLPSEIGLQRSRARGDAEQRFEKERETFHHSVREAFRQRALSEPGRMRVVDASLSIDALSERIWELTGDVRNAV
ncbi:dTMP kinase [Magnetofaba australis]|uniref:Thymidylate kinase n=1 Tax=Magnetofaba australis IT-1 TaxID=1434232 RepID=A0A1Y2K6E4_9PROT|nr:dTMP kinase [Magnetofaba australis]OSM05242.1 putative thymidylate kinase [Magnetofaba australis IT-1]